jgi:hypothetical protein
MVSGTFSISGLTMPTQIILGHWNPSKVKWRFETHCCGPQGCPATKPAQPITYQAGVQEWCMSMMMMWSAPWREFR